MTGDAPTKVLVRRPARNTADSRRRSVGADPVESAKLELVSTQTLKHILASSNDQNRNAIADAADTATDGVLARDPATGFFEIIDDADLQTILDSNSDLPQLSRPVDVTLEPLRDYADNENLSLVTTLALRKVLSTDDNESSPESEFDSSGMDPDNSS
jgi:carboxylesterase type B